MTIDGTNLFANQLELCNIYSSGASFPPALNFPTALNFSTGLNNFNFVPNSISNFTIPDYSFMLGKYSTNSIFGSNSLNFLPTTSNNPFEFLKLSTPTNNTIPTQTNTTNNLFGFLNTTSTSRTNKSTTSIQTTPNKSARKCNLDQEFINGVKQIAKELNCDYKDLLAVMNAESGLNPQAYNANGGASGLIQFMPATAKRYGVTAEQIRNMSATEQLPYIKQYLADAKRSAGFSSSDKLSAGDLYSLVFLPGRAKRNVLCTSNESYYTCNSGLDKDHDGQITKQDLTQQVYSKQVAIA